MHTRSLAAIVAVFVSIAPAFAQGKTYIAVGDSFALGYTTSGAAPTNGDAGYVNPFANFIGTYLNGGVRPTVRNVAVSGESTSSFISGQTTQINTSPTLFDAPLRNTTYNNTYPAAATPQAAFFNSTVDSVLAGGGTVDYITVQIGGNDILGLLAQADFRNLTAIQQAPILQSQFNKLAANYVTILGAIKLKAPNARILTIGYPNSLAGLGGLNPVPNSGALTTQANSIIQSVSQAFGATYVDIFTPFSGNEATLTRITTLDNGIPNVHPTPQGYSLIAAQLGQAVSPEPAALALILPVIAVGVIRRRRNR